MTDTQQIVQSSSLKPRITGLLTATVDTFSSYKSLDLGSTPPCDNSSNQSQDTEISDIHETSIIPSQSIHSNNETGNIPSTGEVTVPSESTKGMKSVNDICTSTNNIIPPKDMEVRENSLNQSENISSIPTEETAAIPSNSTEETAAIPSNSTEVTAAIPSNATEVTATIPSNSTEVIAVIPSKATEVTAVIPSNSTEVVSAIPSISAEVTSVNPSTSIEVTAAIPSISAVAIPSNSTEIPVNIPSNSTHVTATSSSNSTEVNVTIPSNSTNVTDTVTSNSTEVTATTPSNSTEVTATTPSNSTDTYNQLPSNSTKQISSASSEIVESMYLESTVETTTVHTEVMMSSSESQIIPTQSTCPEGITTDIEPEVDSAFLTSGLSPKVSNSSVIISSISTRTTESEELTSESEPCEAMETNETSIEPEACDMFDTPAGSEVKNAENLTSAVPNLGEVHQTHPQPDSPSLEPSTENIGLLSEPVSDNLTHKSQPVKTESNPPQQTVLLTPIEEEYITENVSDNNVISIPEYSDTAASLCTDGSITVSNLGTLKLENGGRIQVSQGYSQLNLPSHITLSNGNTIVINQNNILAAAMAGNITGDIITSSGNHEMRYSSTTTSRSSTKMEQGLGNYSKPPSTAILLQTAKEVLQLPDDPVEYRRVFTSSGREMNVTVDSAGNILSTSSVEDQGDLDITEDVTQMEVTEENGTYILEPVSSEEFYEDPNIMWIEETVEVEQESYDNLPNMVIILNPNGTVNEELMLANGMNMETIKAVTDAATGGINLHTLIPPTSTSSNAPISISSLKPIPKNLLSGVHPICSTAPRSIIESAVPVTEFKNETQRSVILDPKDDYLVLDDVKDPMLLVDGGMKQMTRIININGTQHIISSNKPIPELRKINNAQVGNLYNMFSSMLPVTPLGTLDLSLPKKVDSNCLDQFVNPSALVSENTVLKVLDESDYLKVKRNSVAKIRRPRMRDENGNGSPYIHRKTTSLGALGQALHGMPRDSRENAVQICPICKFQATTKNPYRHLQDHLARMHFKDRIAAELPTKKPYICPFEGCDGKQYPDWQAVMRHYIGKKHGILDKYVKEELMQIRRDNGGRIPGTVIRPGVEIML